MKGILLDKDILIEPHALLDGGITGIVIGDITYQNQYGILIAHPGEYKYSPITGVGINSYLDDESPEALFMEIRSQFSTDGMKVQKVGFSENGNLVIEAAY